MADELPYRFEAAEGKYAGTTFVYLADGRTVSYATGSPAWYYTTWPARPGQIACASFRHAMTPAALARFTAVPLRQDEP